MFSETGKVWVRWLWFTVFVLVMMVLVIVVLSVGG